MLWPDPGSKQQPAAGCKGEFCHQRAAISLPIVPLPPAGSIPSVPLTSDQPDSSFPPPQLLLVFSASQTCPAWLATAALPATKPQLLKISARPVAAGACRCVVAQGARSTARALAARRRVSEQLAWLTEASQLCLLALLQEPN